MIALAPVLPLVLALVVLQAPPPTPVPPATPAPMPSSGATTPPGPSPVPAATLPPPPPVPTPTPLYRFVYRPTPSAVTTPFPGPNPPEIDEIDLNDSSLQPPAPLHVRVLTSADVVSVSAETFGRSIAIPQKYRGEFTFDGYIPDVPPFLRNRTFDVQFIATVNDGRSASVTLPLTLR